MSVLEVVALEQLHGHVDLALLLAEVVDGDDVRMVEAGGGLRLALEALAQLVVGADGGRHRLDGDVAVEDGVVGPDRPRPWRPGRSCRRSRTCRSGGSSIDTSSAGTDSTRGMREPRLPAARASRLHWPLERYTTGSMSKDPTFRVLGQAPDALASATRPTGGSGTAARPTWTPSDHPVHVDIEIGGRLRPALRQLRGGPPGLLPDLDPRAHPHPGLRRAHLPARLHGPRALRPADPAVRGHRRQLDQAQLPRRALAAPAHRLLRPRGGRPSASPTS